MEEKFCCHIFKDWVSQYVTEKRLSSYEQRSLAWAGIQSCLLSSEQETATKELASSDFMSWNMAIKAKDTSQRCLETLCEQTQISWLS